MMYKELKKEIIDWLLEHEFEFNRLNKCKEIFRAYIYDDKGAYLICGQNVYTFIVEADKLLYNKN